MKNFILTPLGRKPISEDIDEETIHQKNKRTLDQMWAKRHALQKQGRTSQAQEMDQKIGEFLRDTEMPSTRELRLRTASKNVQEGLDPHASHEEMHDHLVKSGYVLTGASSGGKEGNMRFYSHKTKNTPITVHWMPPQNPRSKTKAYARIHSRGAGAHSAVTLNGLKAGIEMTS